MPQPLSSKESSLFRTVIRNYEDKQYKKGLKAADQILKKNPKHGDTLAMKALIINSQGKTEEAFALGKVALQNDMKSHVCWHVYGLLYRANKNFEEAIKAYKFALRLEPDSQQIQRDLALLQIQMRDYQGYVTSRKAMLKARSHVRQSWTSLAVAHHLAGNLVEAEATLTTYEETLKNPPSKTDIENSEALLYKNTIIAELGETQRALDHLEAVAKKNLDRVGVMELRVKYLTELDRKEDAAKALRALLDRNPEHKAYYDELIAILGLGASDHKAMKAIYDGYADKFPRSDAPRRLPLDFLEGEDFREVAETYIQRMMDKGIPSTFANLKHLYSNESKRDSLPQVVEEYITKKKGQSNDEPKRNGDASKGDAAAYYYLAQHYNYHLSRDLSKATEYIDKAIELDSGNVDFVMTKARIWKHYGNPQKAAEIMESARKMDESDRHISTKTAKYQLRNDEHEAAIKTMGRFTRAEAAGGPLGDLLDMQCVWFLTEDGESYARKGSDGLALKRFHAIHAIFDAWQEDQFDFHNFSIRRGQIRAYIDLMRWEDRLREHPMFGRAALAAVRVYLDMHARGHAETNGVNGSAGGAGGAHAESDALEKKKAAKKARVEAERAAKEASARKQEPNKAVKDGDGVPKKVDDDPHGVKLAATADPLRDSLKFLNPLLQFNPKSIDAQLSGFEVYMGLKKYLLALKCLLAASKLAPSHPRVHEQTLVFASTIRGLPKAARSGSEPESEPESLALKPQAAELIASEFTLAPADASLDQLNERFLAVHRDSAPHVLAAARSMRHLRSESGTKAGEVDGVAERLAASVLEIEDVSLSEAVEGWRLLGEWKKKSGGTAGGSEAAYREKARGMWPRASVFGEE